MVYVDDATCLLLLLEIPRLLQLGLMGEENMCRFSMTFLCSFYFTSPRKMAFHVHYYIDFLSLVLENRGKWKDLRYWSICWHARLRYLLLSK